jgi:hypothetical protein
MDFVSSLRFRAAKVPAWLLNFKSPSDWVRLAGASHFLAGCPAAA